MPVVPLQCPHCANLIQVDSATGGQQLGCPYCQGPFVVPPEDVLMRLLAAAETPPPPPPADELFTLACPACAGPFQVLASMSGQQLGCPHCGMAVTIPPLSAPSEEPPGQPPSFEPPREFGLPVQQPAWSDREPPSVQPSRAAPALATAASDRFPPGMSPPAEAKKETADARRTEAKSKPSAPSSREATDGLPPKPARPALADLLPPGAAAVPPSAGAKKPAFEPPSARQEPKPAALQPEPPADETSSAAPLESLLPPGAAEAPVSAPLLSPRPSDAETLLPPGAAPASSAPEAGEQVALPKAPKKAPVAPANVPAGTIAVPTPDGGFVTVRETPKIIGHGEEEIEVRRLTPQEKEQRRFRRNLILGVICLAIILAVFAALVWR